MSGLSHLEFDAAQLLSQLSKLAAECQEQQQEWKQRQTDFAAAHAGKDFAAAGAALEQMLDELQQAKLRRAQMIAAGVSLFQDQVKHLHALDASNGEAYKGVE